MSLELLSGLEIPENLMEKIWFSYCLLDIIYLFDSSREIREIDGSDPWKSPVFWDAIVPSGHSCEAETKLFWKIHTTRKEWGLRSQGYLAETLLFIAEQLKGKSGEIESVRLFFEANGIFPSFLEQKFGFTKVDFWLPNVDRDRPTQWLNEWKRKLKRKIESN